eukprot:m.171163 g.171163  ORF g.171163 m.171163 type:complete len:635 (+) comp17265_c0_seq3:461-2365(+)
MAAPPFDFATSFFPGDPFGFDEPVSTPPRGHQHHQQQHLQAPHMQHLAHSPLMQSQLSLQSQQQQHQSTSSSQHHHHHQLSQPLHTNDQSHIPIDFLRMHYDEGGLKSDVTSNDASTSALGFGFDFSAASLDNWLQQQMPTAPSLSLNPQGSPQPSAYSSITAGLPSHTPFSLPTSHPPSLVSSTHSASNSRQHSRITSPQPMPAPSSFAFPFRGEDDDDDPEASKPNSGENSGDEANDSRDEPGERPSKRSASAKARQAPPPTPKAPVLGLSLLPVDELQCRFTVKNDTKPGNQTNSFLQGSGYLEFKARYSKKRGQPAGYGFFSLAFMNTPECVFPFATASRETVISSDPSFKSCSGLEITVRYFQSFRGVFPTFLVDFGDGEVYHPLFVSGWQDATLLLSPESAKMCKGVAVDSDPSGEYVRYTVTNRETLDHLLRQPDGVKFPCPVPVHPEQLNDVGMLRMQIAVRFLYADGARSASAEDLSVWLRVKIVQQMTGKKRMFSTMRRDASDGSVPWSLPPQPSLLRPRDNFLRLLGQVTGQPVTPGLAYSLLGDLARDVVQFQKGKGTHAIHMAARDGRLDVVQMLVTLDKSLVNLLDSQGMSPVRLASMNGHAVVEKYLLEVMSNNVISRS